MVDRCARLVPGLLALACAASAAAGEPEVVAALREADRTGTHWPRASQIEPALAVDGAYRVQSAYVRSRLGGAAPAGYKGGFMARAQQARYGLQGPVAGVLYPGGELANGATVPADRVDGLLVEAEIGWTMVRAIAAPVADAAAMAALVAQAMPVLELPRVRFAAPGELTGVDLVAVGVATEFHVVGSPLVLSSATAADALEVVLRHDGTEVARAPGSVPMGSQMEALRWLVNRVLDLGWPIGPGQVFITGALAAPVPGAPGEWSAEYGSGARVSVHVPAPSGD